MALKTITCDQVQIAKASRPLSAEIGKTVRLVRAGAGGRLKGLCPFHAEKTPSFIVDDSRGFYHCFGCTAHGDLIEWVIQSRGMAFAEAVAELLTGVDLERPVQIGQLTAKVSADAVRRLQAAAKIWETGRPIGGTVAEVYLRDTRGLLLPRVPGVLRYCPALYCSAVSTETPALLARLDAGRGFMTAIQAIHLDVTTGDAVRDQGRRVKRTHGPMNDGAVRLASPRAVLALAGSVEDALSVTEMFGLPCWASCGEGRFGAVTIPSGVERVIIFADSDQSGRALAAKGAKALAAPGRRVDISFPREGKDWNDVRCSCAGRAVA